MPDSSDQATPAAHVADSRSEEKRHGSPRPGSAPRVSTTGPPPGIHRGRGAFARPRHRRQRRDLRVLRRLRPPSRSPTPSPIASSRSARRSRACRATRRFIEAISIPEFLDIKAARTIRFDCRVRLGNRNISGGDRPERVLTALAVTDLFGPFGLRPALGRGFTSEELAEGPGVAVISYRLWQGRFGGDPNIVGSVGEGQRRAAHGGRRDAAGAADLSARICGCPSGSIRTRCRATGGSSP